jgi:hypothetical protein
MNIRAKIFSAEEAGPELLGSKKPKGAKAEKLESVTVQREERRRSNGRNQDRHRLLDEKIRLTHRGRARKVELINLSGGGAMVSGFEPKLWDKVELHLGENGTIECAVRWIREGRVGLEFAHETHLDCSADKQAHVLREVVVRSFPDLKFEEHAAPEPQPEEHRIERRHPLIWSGTLHHRGSDIRVRVRNISSTGAMIETSEPVLVGGQAILELGEDGFIPGTVAWMVGDLVGLRFRGRFDLSQLAKARPDVAAQTWVAPDYLKAAKGDDSPWSKNWGRMSIGELRQQLEGFLKY